jgi:CHAD domain-containing protein
MHEQPQAYDDGYWAFAADALLQRLDAVAHEAAGVRQGQDIEFVHRMRVASRRLRSAIAIFDDCLSSGGFSGFKKPIRRITRELGAARDIDVQLEALESFLKHDPDPAHQPGIERLMLRLHQQREKLQVRVVEAIGRLEASTVWQEMQRPLRELAVRANLRGVRRESRALRHSATRAINLELEGLLGFEPYIEQPDRVDELHQMRIAAKKLRYCIEIFAPLFTGAGALDEFLSAAKEIQKVLGAIHDCDVWGQMLPVFLEDERQRTFEYFGHTRHFARLASGIDFMRAEKTRERAEHYEEFLTYWKELRARGVWEKLHRVLNHPHSAGLHDHGAAKADAPAHAAGSGPAAIEIPARLPDALIAARHTSHAGVAATGNGGSAESSAELGGT